VIFSRRKEVSSPSPHLVIPLDMNRPVGTTATYQPAKEIPVPNFGTVLIGDVEVAAEKILAFVTKANNGLSKDSPAAIPALATILGAVGTAVEDAATGASNPAQLLITLPQDVADYKAVWADVKAFAATVGIKL
jgi:hypothetical protein